MVAMSPLSGLPFGVALRMNAGWSLNVLAETTSGQVGNILDKASHEFASKRSTYEVMKDFEAAVQRIRSQASVSEWKSCIVPQIRKHAVMQFLLQDPFTKHSFEKPRGYPGDAALLDLVYLEPEALRSANHPSQLGWEIFEYTSNVKASKAVRARKEFLARKIELAVSQKPKCRILSVACGHLRELELITTPEKHSFGEFIAFDQDMHSLKSVDKAWRHLGVRAVTGNVRDLIRNKFKDFDLIYAAGLYDYLTASTAKRLTAKLFELLNPNGVLVIANFLPDVWESGYMEAVMDWWLLQRSLVEIESFIEMIPSSQISTHDIKADAYDRIGYLNLTKI